ncbi:MAG: hypothetical protein KME27_12240 [Lyngbya sp. HA4199-MV5]|jgi:uncharacterized protein YwbE|nr:hypothetical protein [Lyngbya sp. HA4199-MV5]
MSRSLLAKSFSKRLLTATGLAMLTAFPATASAFHPTAQPTSLDGTTLSQTAQGSQWLVADKKDGKNGKKDRDDDRGRGRDRDDDDREVRIDLNRAKNLARQAAEAANGGIQYYRAEDSMHGPASACPYVDNGDSWTFTFLGDRVGSYTRTLQSVVTVYKNSSRIVVAYNGPIRTVQQTQITSFTTTQRTVLTELLQGNCSCNSLLTNATRTQIISQSQSLPPGIQKRLLRGKGLPPGIAKKLVPLPKQVNSYINLPTNYDLFVIGSNVLLVDRVNTVVVDYISDVFVSQTTSSTTTSFTTTSFTTSQRSTLIEMLQGDCSCGNVLTSATRTQIISQSRSLPPGIQKQLLRGKGLPPGIAKKLVPLPKQVNSYINLPTTYDLFVVGSNIVLVDQVNYVVVDYITNVFL